jgi:hypothetical protein
LKSRKSNFIEEVNVPLIPCPECSQEISDHAISCPKCGFPIKENKHITSELPAMIWDSEDGACICVICPKCYKSSIIKKTTAQKTNTGYSLDGEGTCSCGLIFDEIERKSTLNSSPVFTVNQPSRHSTTGNQLSKFTCPSCKSGNTVCKRDIGCAVMIVIFISFGLGLIMIPFLPYKCRCNSCGYSWKS